MQVVVDQLLTNYELSGKGGLVLLLHGWGDSLKTFSTLRKDLSENYQVLAVDLPGFGGTQVPKETWDLDNYAEFVGHLLEKLRLEQPYAVVGHSNGGAVAIRAISLGPLQPEKLVLMAASGIRTTQKMKRVVLKFIAKVGNLATIWMPERYRRALRKSLYDAAGSDLLVAPQLEETFKKTVRQDVQKDAAQLETDTLLIYAKQDETVPLSYGRLYEAYIKNSKLEEIDDAGHFVHLDRPEKVNKLIEDFLR
jgi:pimeloyl-ACP methyl ester carboxylesterase